MELMLLLLAGGLAGAVALMPNEGDAVEIDTSEADEDTLHLLDEESAGSGSDPSFSFVKGQDTHTMTKLAFQRWEDNTHDGADVTWLDNPPEGAIEEHVVGTAEDDRLGFTIGGFDPEATGEPIGDDFYTPRIATVEAGAGNDRVEGYIPYKHSPDDHAYGIYGGSGDDWLAAERHAHSAAGYGADASSNGVIYGGAGNDSLRGNAAAEIYGGSGDDNFMSFTNANVYGGEGDDHFNLPNAIAARGDWNVLPRVYGGEGEDSFELNPFAANMARISAIHDFETGVDKIYFAEFDPETVVVNETEDGTEIVLHNATKGWDSVIWLEGVSGFTQDDMVFGPYHVFEQIRHPLTK
jgi:hypothetical protein